VARRIDSAVVRGEIDNTVEGRTSGWIWLLGRSDPIALELDGDCWRDLAGARLKFRNPKPRPGRDLDLEGAQHGVIGDMTASRKSRVAGCPEEELLARRAAGEEPPEEWRNTLYLEWFSDSDGRVVIESAEFELELSDRAWEMDRDAEEAQKLANLQAMRDFLNRVIARRPPPPEGAPLRDDEFEWEERLKESDRLTDAYQEVMEKYMHDPDAERKEAFVMGWDGLLEAMADEAEGREPEKPAWMSEDFEFGDGDEDELDGDEWRDEEDQQHPVQAEAQELALRSFDLVRDDQSECSGASGTLVGELMKVSAKLAGALNGGYECETGYVLAILKRCIDWIQQALGACATLIEAEQDHDQCRALEALRDEVFVLRQRLIEMRRELKGG